MQPTAPMAPKLDYLRSSPVRGQLEDWDPRTTKGWRYIQTTDTLNQLKVLLPPGTAAMYEQLLKFESFELRKKSTISWERILQIRHLKDRMIHKCRKLAKTAGHRKLADAPAFQTIVAPADFRFREMEKWFREQQRRTNALLHLPSPRPQALVAQPPHTSSSQCPQCIAARRRASRSGVTSPRRTMPLKAMEDKLSVRKSNRQQLQPTTPTTVPQKSFTPPLRPTVETITACSPQPSVSSTPPLPHLLRIRDLESGFDLSVDPQRIVFMPPKRVELHPFPVVEPETEKNPSTQAPTSLQDPEENPQLTRRRSCIKRTSNGDLSKTVSWADDRRIMDQSDKFVLIAREAQTSGRKWEEIHDVYFDQMSGLGALQSQVEECMTQLQSEVEHLRRADETIRRQREMLRSTFEDLEKKQRRFQAQVQELLADTDHTLSLANSKV